VAEGRKPKEILDDIVHQTGYVQWLERDQGEESLETSHAANVREILRIAERFDTAEELLDYIDEMGAKAARSKRGGGERVLLMSVHRSKGLEWPNVWVSGCNENILPHAKGNPEEERRLMYVAITRARDSLVLSYVSKFAQREGVRPAQPSRFLRDAGLVP
jgi:DNA helicase-2/ATP-dependent DNA helicase PcrA